MKNRQDMTTPRVLQLRFSSHEPYWHTYWTLFFFSNFTSPSFLLFCSVPEIICSIRITHINDYFHHNKQTYTYWNSFPCKIDSKFYLHINNIGIHCNMIYDIGYHTDIIRLTVQCTPTLFFCFFTNHLYEIRDTIADLYFAWNIKKKFHCPLHKYPRRDKLKNW